MDWHWTYFWIFYSTKLFAIFFVSFQIWVSADEWPLFFAAAVLDLSISWFRVTSKFGERWLGRLYPSLLDWIFIECLSMLTLSVVEWFLFKLIKFELNKKRLPLLISDRSIIIILLMFVNFLAYKSLGILLKLQNQRVFSKDKVSESLCRWTSFERRWVNCQVSCILKKHSAFFNFAKFCYPKSRNVFLIEKCIFNHNL